MLPKPSHTEIPRRSLHRRESQNRRPDPNVYRMFTAAIECTNPVTGAVITTDANASYPTRQEPDPLGRDLVTPPDVGVVSEPLGNNLIQQHSWPIEYTGGQTGELEIGMAIFAGYVA